MVQTRSQSGSPSKPPTPRSKRKVRTKLQDDSSSDEEGTIELGDIKMSLADHLEPITEEDENDIVLDSMDDGSKVKSLVRTKFGAVKQINRAPKTPLKIPDTIAEESEEASSSSGGKMKEVDKNPEDISDSASLATSSKPKYRFYFPPPKSLVPSKPIQTSIDVGMEMPETYIDVKGTKEGKKKIDRLHTETTVSKKDSRVKDSVITSDFERNLTAPAEKSLKQKWKERKAEREASAGKEWFNLKPPEMTPEVKRDLKILQMRGVIDPKRFYKHNDRKVLPKYFQVGKIMDSAADFYSSRVPKKQRKANLTEELLADAQFQKYQKRKYNELQIQKKARNFKKLTAKRRKFSNKEENAS